MLQHWSPSPCATFRKWDDLIILLYKAPKMLPHDYLIFFNNNASFFPQFLMHMHLLRCPGDQTDANWFTFYFYFILMEQHWVQDWIITNLSDWKYLLVMLSDYNCRWETHFVKMSVIHLKKQGQHLVRRREERKRRSRES